MITVANYNVELRKKNLEEKRVLAEGVILGLTNIKDRTTMDLRKNMSEYPLDIIYRATANLRREGYILSHVGHTKTHSITDSGRDRLREIRKGDHADNTI